MLVLDPDFPEMLGTIAHAIYEALVGLSVGNDEAQRMTYVLIDAVRKRVGGSSFYLPSGKEWDAKLRRLSVLADLAANPGRYREVARRHNLSEVRVRDIEKESREERRALTKTP